LLPAFILFIFLSLYLVSAACYKSRTAWVAIPSIVCVYSLLQSMLAAGLLNALGGIGH
jgi:hypothetical protein